MADELQIQQGTNTTPYTLTGAAIGAAGGGLGSYYLTKPKYGSYEDIMAESKDSFDKKVADASEEDKKFLEEAKALRETKANAEAEYDKLLEDYKKEHGSAKVETDEYKKLVSDYEAAEKALNDKKTELINKEVERLKAAGATDKTATIEKSLNNKAKQIANATKRYETLKASGAKAEDIAAAKQKVEALEKEAEELSKKIAEKFEFKGLTGDALEAKKKEVADAYKLAIQDRVAQKLKLFDAPLETEDAKLVKRFKNNRTAVQKQNEALDKAFAQLKELTGTDIKAIYDSAHPNMINDKLGKATAVEEIKIERLTNLKEALKNASEKTPDSRSFSLRTLIEALGKLGRGETLDAVAPDVKATMEQYLKDNFETELTELEEKGAIRAFETKNGRKATAAEKVDILKKATQDKTNNQLEIIKKLIGEDISEKSLDDAIAAAKKKQDEIAKVTESAGKAVSELSTTITEDLTKVKDLSTVEIKTPADEAAVLKEQMRRKNVYVNKDGVLIDKKTKKPIKSPSIPAEKPAEVKLPAGVTEPKDAKIEYTSRVASGLSEEELRKQAETAVKPETYQEQTEALNKAKAAKETAYNGLKDGTAKSEEDIAKELNESLKVKDRQAFVDSKIEAGKKGFVEKYAEKIKRKWGFAEHTSLKIAGATAVGAAVIGGIAYMFAPKNKN